MKKIFIACSAVLALFASCKKDGLQLQPTTNVDDQAYVKVMYYSPAPNANFLLKVNETKIGPSFFYSQVNPSDGTAYLGVPAGSGSAKFVLPKAGTTEDSVVISSFNYTLDKGSYYSLFMIDTGSKVRPLILNDTLDLPADGFAKVRFVNTMYNVPAVDIKLSDGTLVASRLAFGAATPFITVTAGQLYGYRFYNPGTTTQLTGTSATTFKLDITPSNQRIYTIALRGVASASTNAPIITTITHR